MAVDDLWFRSRRERDATGKLLPKQPAKRHGRGRRYRVRYVDDAGATRVRLFPDGQKGRAEQFDASVRTDVARGLYVDPVAGREIVETACERWRTAQLFRPGTAERVERTLRLHIYPVIGKLPLSHVRASHIQRWATELDLAPSSSRVAYSYLVSMFTAAVRDRAIAVSPCTGITLPTAQDSEEAILTPAQVHAVAEEMLARFRAGVYLGAGCGLRGGEVLGLELNHVDFLRREVHVRQQLTVVTGGGPYIGPPKTRASRRTVELPKVTADALARHLEEYPVRPVEITDRTDARKTHTREARLLFTSETGRPIHRAVWSRQWRRRRRRQGCRTEPGSTRCGTTTPHC